MTLRVATTLRASLRTSRFLPAAQRARDWREWPLAQVVQGSVAFPAQVLEVGHSDQLFKTAFLQMASSAALLALQRSVLAALHEPDDYAFDPHLSLIYKVLPEAARVQLAREFDAPATFLCDSLSVVVPSPGGWADVAGWQVQHSVSLPSRRAGMSCELGHAKKPTSAAN